MTTELVLNKIVYTNRETLVWLCLLKKIMLPISRFLRLHSATWHYDTGGTGTLCSSTEWKIPDKLLSWKCGFDFCCLLKKHSQQKLDGTRDFFFHPVSQMYLKPHVCNRNNVCIWGPVQKCHCAECDSLHIQPCLYCLHTQNDKL